MSFKNTLESVTKDIQEIEKIVSKFQNYSRIPRIELDLTLSKLRNVYELLLMIREHEDGIEDLETGQSETEPETLQEEPDLNVKSADILDIEEEKKPEKQDQVTAENSSGQQEEVPVKKEQPKIEEPGKPVSSGKEKVLGEKFERDGDFLNEKLGETTIKSSSRLQGGQITSIAGSMGINDRFYYIREIFDGNSDNFKKSIEILDQAGNFNEAFNYIKTQMMADLENDAVQNLLNLVRRKFISSGNE